MRTVAVPSELAELQRWMQEAILSPDGAPADRGRGIADVITASSRLSAEQRLAIYWRGYRLRLLDCLRACYPTLRQLLGQDAFDTLAAEYVDARPSRSYTLDLFGAGFADHLHSTRPDQELPLAERDPWPDLVIDMARFERAFGEVYGTVDRDTPDPSGHTAVHRVLPVRFPVHAYAAAVARGEDPAPPAARSAVLVLHRHHHEVVVTEVTEPMYRAYATSRATRGFGSPLAEASPTPLVPSPAREPGHERSDR